MFKILTLFGGLTFVGFGIIAGQSLLVKFARSIDLKTASVGSVILNALQTPYLYGAALLYFCAIMSYLYISRIVTFSALNLTVTGLIIIMTLCADIFFFKEDLNWAHFAGAAFMLLGLAFILFSTRNAGAI